MATFFSLFSRKPLGILSLMVCLLFFYAFSCNPIGNGSGNGNGSGGSGNGNNGSGNGSGNGSNNNNNNNNKKLEIHINTININIYPGGGNSSGQSGSGEPGSGDPSGQSGSGDPSGEPSGQPGSDDLSGDPSGESGSGDPSGESGSGESGSGDPGSGESGSGESGSGDLSGDPGSGDPSGQSGSGSSYGVPTASTHQFSVTSTEGLNLGTITASSVCECQSGGGGWQVTGLTGYFVADPALPLLLPPFVEFEIDGTVYQIPLDGSAFTLPIFEAGANLEFYFNDNLVAVFTCEGTCEGANGGGGMAIWGNLDSGNDFAQAEPSLSDLSVFPNPARDAFTYSFEVSESTSATVSLFDLTGREVWRDEADVVGGSYRRRVEISDHVQPGTYLLRVQAGGKTLTKKLLVQQ